MLPRPIRARQTDDRGARRRRIARLDHAGWRPDVAFGAEPQVFDDYVAVLAPLQRFRPERRVLRRQAEQATQLQRSCHGRFTD